MNNGLLQILVEEDYGYKKEGRNWGRAEQHSSLVVNEEDQKWFWNSEGMGGDILSYLTMVRKLNKKKAEEILALRGKMVSGSILEAESNRESAPYEKLVDLLWMLGKNNRDYWYSRKLTDKTIDRFRLGFYNGWNTLPLYENGLFVNFQCRRDKPTKFIKYWYEHAKPVLINTEVLGLVDTVYITEGTVDSILLNQEGVASVASTGGAGYWDDNWFTYFSKVKNIYYIADNDKAGRFAAYRVSTSLGVDKTKIYMYDGKAEKYDTVDYFRDGGNIKELKELVESNSRYQYEIEEINERSRKKKGRRLSGVRY